MGTLWGFLAVAVPFIMSMIITAIFTEHRKSMKMLEIENQKVQQTNVQNEVSDAVKREIGEILKRIETLEAIVTDRKYQLDEKITRLK
ncbi:MAG: hypothetical protein GKR91_06340 [Pseudomonadales bacterium]|nr:hypothetical protein [Pseudomonadales bacterium]